jgi:E3 ubiquitin-protein ligase makorin
MPALHPTNEKQRDEHRLVNSSLVLLIEKVLNIFLQECLRKHEADCEEAFATQRSQDKKCGVCLETVWDRDGDKRFGILENCDHIFCLECIRKWRASSNYDNKVVKAW